MAQTSMTFRVDNSLKKNFDTLCEEFGFTTTAAITVFMKTVVRERRIPFEIKATSKDEINVKGWEAILEMGKQAEEAGIQDMSLEEINAIIKEARDAPGMHDKYYAVLDTNVLVSALLGASHFSNPTKVLKAVTENRIIPLYNNEIIEEYRNVLSRKKFPFSEELIVSV